MSELEPPPSSVNRFPVEKSGGYALLPINWINWLNNVHEKLRGPLWYDMLAPVNTGRVAASAPALSTFGPGSITQQYQFNRGEGILLGFHMNHDIKPGSKMYPHVHWSTDGTAATAGVSDTVEWVIDWIVAKGHQQEAFAAGSTSPISMTQSVFNSVVTSGPTAWHHYITEVSDAQAIDAPEVDSLLLMRVTRGSTNDTYSNAGAGHVFGLFVDIHYQRDRFGTPGKSPDFYSRTRS